MQDTAEVMRMRVTERDGQLVGECLEHPVMTHGRTVEELVENMRKALALYLREDEARDGECVVAFRRQERGD